MSASSLNFSSITRNIAVKKTLNNSGKAGTLYAAPAPSGTTPSIRHRRSAGSWPSFTHSLSTAQALELYASSGCRKRGARLIFYPRGYLNNQHSLLELTPVGSVCRRSLGGERHRYNIYTAGTFNMPTSYQ